MAGKKWLIVGGVAALALAAWLLYPRIATRGVGRDSCREIPTAAGVGDIAVDTARGVAYLAYLDRTSNAEGQRPTGTIMLVDLNAKEPRVRAALSSDPQHFRPIALSLYAPEQGVRRLFVLDRGDGVLAVQVFEQSATGAFTLVQTLHDSRLANPTAIVASGPDQFYVVSPGPWWQFGRQSVAYFNGQTLVTPSEAKAREIAEATMLAKREHADAAGKYGKYLLIGSLTDHKLLLCENAG
ncbi:MAG TPA: hypothetical protein VG994_20925 [Steroidobacteraceae bacterium]|nr:hypothetical protein [Steroidobacteraceae bacterium]